MLGIFNILTISFTYLQLQRYACTKKISIDIIVDGAVQNLKLRRNADSGH